MAIVPIMYVINIYIYIIHSHEIIMQLHKMKIGEGISMIEGLQDYERCSTRGEKVDTEKSV